MTRYAFRVDATQAAIVSALEAAGATVEIIGLPVDLSVGYIDSAGVKRFAYFECKVPVGKRAPKPSKTTLKQDKFIAKYPGWPICLVDSPEAALHHLRVLQS